MARPTFQAPKGTRDFYPQDLLRRRYIEKIWRDTSIRHGFEEIEGPTFETAALYKVKSGEGILGEMFGVFSGKSEEDVKQVRESGEAPFALRPEFTPTLARMYAARAAQLPKPCKWFTAGPYFRAERPQRGRLREFCQWNVDFIGGADAVESESYYLAGDFDVLMCCIYALAQFGLTGRAARAKFNYRKATVRSAAKYGIEEARASEVFDLLDKMPKMREEEFNRMLNERHLSLSFFEAIRTAPVVRADSSLQALDLTGSRGFDLLFEDMRQVEIATWCEIDARIIRGLAYYTGLVFEVIAEGERAVAGGGRYDNLIELFGGPPTPAVGFGMGDVVLGNLLDDKGLMPEGSALLEALSAPGASLRPDVFVIANEKEESQAAVRPLVARLRRGVESQAWLSRADRKPWDRDRYGSPARSTSDPGWPARSASGSGDSDSTTPISKRTSEASPAAERQATPPLHARHSYKATKNIGKLLKEASDVHARFAVIIESAEHGTLKNLTTGEQTQDVPLAEIGARVAT